MEDHKKNRSQIWRIRAIAVGAAVGVLTAAAALTALTVAVLVSGRYDAVAPFAAGATVLAGLAAGFVTARGSRRNPLPNAAAAALASGLVLAAASAAAGGGAGALWAAAICAAGGAAGALPGTRLRYRWPE